MNHSIRQTSGTGLDLAIAYCTMEDHGGTIQVSSTSEIGTTVVLSFPVVVVASQPLVVTS